jgi:hypothetical protein
MKVKLSAWYIIFSVIFAAFLGMILCGLFGFVAAFLAPELFEGPHGDADTQPYFRVLVLGAFLGMWLGGALGVLGVIVEAVGRAVAAGTPAALAKEDED